MQIRFFRIPDALSTSILFLLKMRSSKTCGFSPSPTQADEYVVYSPHQQRVQYLVEFSLPGDEEGEERDEGEKEREREGEDEDELEEKNGLPLEGGFVNVALTNV